MENKNLKLLTVFDNYEIIKLEKDTAIVKTIVEKSNLNLFENAHGGYLFALCDSVSGYVFIGNGTDVVTLSSSINYIKGTKLGDELTITAKILHNGRNTKVVDTKITNQDDRLIVKSTFTMYPIKK